TITSSSIPRHLQDACDKIGHCDTGSAVITPGFHMKSKYIIHAVGPVWRGGKHNEKELLRTAYRRCSSCCAGSRRTSGISRR
ncbi:MAG: macro domain-containing protein, partial [Lachnospiraceae bacterium]|nr:macro domain-containing protein [Lachnospiraceae bacterium]